MLDLTEEIVRFVAAESPEAKLPTAAQAWLREATPGELAKLCTRLAELPSPAADSPAAEHWTRLLKQIELRWRPLDGERTTQATSAGKPLAIELRASLATLYRHLGASSRARRHLLGALTAARCEAELRLFADLVADDPPSDPVDAALALWPLFTAKDYDPAWLFPRLLEGLAHPSLTASLLDLANYLVREGRVATHPAGHQAARLVELLGGIVGRLGQMAERPVAAGDSHEQLRDAVAEGTAMAVSLCDALALIGDSVAIPKLYQALALGHRRLRVEAAAALAKLGEEEGRAALVALAAEPLVRLRVLAYAEELGLVERIAAEYRSSEARAEGELVAWLASPHQLGLAPQECELLDRRELHWPGFQEPVECFLFRYLYRLPQGEYRGVGLAGPEARSFAADLSELPLDDIYAAFAGQTASHEEIRELDVGELSPAGEAEIARLERRLKDAGFTALVPVALGFFFGERTLLAEATRGEVRGAAIVDNAGEHWFPLVLGPRQPGPREAYCIYKGRRLLAAFNE